MKVLRNAAVAAMSLLALTSAASYNYLFIGDSITDGNWGSPKGWPCPSENRNTADFNHIYGHGYAEMTIGRLASENPDTATHYYNRGISGNTLPQMAARWDKDAMSLNPDVISILIGTNDVHAALKHGGVLDYAAWENTLDSLLIVSRHRNPDVKLILGTPFTAKAGKVWEKADYDTALAMTRRLAEIVRSVAGRHGATVVPYDELLEKTTADNPQVPASYWLWDGIHPTTQFHALMSQLWLERYAGGENQKR